MSYGEQRTHNVAEAIFVQAMGVLNGYHQVVTDEMRTHQRGPASLRQIHQR